MNDQDKKIIKEALKQGFTFDEAMEFIEKMREAHYTQISYNSERGKGLMIGDDEDVLVGLLALSSKLLQRTDDFEMKLKIITTYEKWVTQKTGELLEKNSVIVSSADELDELNIPEPVKEELRQILNEKFNGK
ncbi:hypothetical protein PLO_0015 [Pediococcus acidilactici NGRI 0510Q]|uniref:Uncharacterized protein n=2 Tax=Pediococcus acidilactici TaxID=1254 RepID=A0AAW8YFD6_PEDAC|nr:hypothetical protein [Pediococcus acidilactici]KRN91883.1 hypothetical protein IV82_GL000290 [Pediococcus acidilactici]MDV2620292.1 hypothetical protein [Pediococcus acidilactici]QJW86795.1 hypothetical protein HN015_04545 [Pediococcus acidilactici]GAC44543.1 hypothetical protein PLO_0015 [Pediococcus acidilactici NGRI 0510Q]